MFAELERPLAEPDAVAAEPTIAAPARRGDPRRRAAAPIRDRRGGGIAGTIGALVAAGEPVLVVAADAAARARHLAPILGGFELCSHEALDARPGARARGHARRAARPPGRADARATVR